MVRSKERSTGCDSEIKGEFAKRSEERLVMRLEARSEDVFITLWAIWNHRNKVVHQGIIPNPMEVILIAQNFSCSYKATLSNSQTPRRRDSRCPNTRQQPAARDWNLIIKTATARSRRQCRYGIVYEALTLQGDKVFFGVASTTARTATEALLEAVIAAGLAGKAQGFQNILFTTDSKGLMQTIKKECVTDWMDSTRLANYCFLK
ncbi:hypothetical protein SO802_017969 [Lithocarpus litseifolius]|uniref:RNase H type-1 domain-containing protein n=1 Tax=Lithocarpus litseifolius TaxID=425828 RepID=A0AAW2CL33_9ROSI